VVIALSVAYRLTRQATHSDVSQAADVYQAILKLFAASSEQIKSAAAFAAGE
jgi:hypothetical protein